MLFDLRGRGRRRTVRVLYIGLALLIGFGLVGFGVGGGFGGGGIFTGLTGNNETSGGGASYTAQIKKYQKLVAEQPKNLSARENLIRTMLNQGGNETYVTSTGAVTAKGKELFNQISESWNSYLALNPPTPNLTLAKEVLRIYGEEGLNKPAESVQALQIIVAAEPTNASFYAELAEYAYKAKNTRVGDLASAKALALAPATERARLKTELASIRANPSGEKTYTTTTNGKTYTGQLNSKGEIKATPQQTTSTTTGAK